MSTQITSPFQQFFDTAGDPLDNGKLYIGEPNLNPITNPVQVFWDAGLTIPATQPIRTSNGYIVRAGTPAQIFTASGDYSLVAQTDAGETIFSVQSSPNSVFDQGVELEIASASTLDIGAQNTNFLRVTGTTNINSFGTNYRGPRFLRFQGALTIAYNASTLLIPGNVNVTTAANDRCIVAPIGNPGSGWQIVSYTRASVPPGGADVLAANATATTQQPFDASTRIATTAYVDQIPYGQCRLILDAGNLKLIPLDGNRLTINTEAERIPSAGVTLSPSGLTPSTLYYIYAYMASGTMTLEASTTGHQTDSTSGIEVKIGDATRTLVGMARPVTGPAFADSQTQRLVRSWFNDPGVFASNILSADASTASLTFTELSSSLRSDFLCWANERVKIWAQGNIQNGTAGQRCATSPRYDGGSTLSTNGAFTSGNAGGANQGFFVMDEGSLTEGYHFSSVFVFVSGGTGVWEGGLSGEQMTLKVACEGR